MLTPPSTAGPIPVSPAVVIVGPPAVDSSCSDNEDKSENLEDIDAEQDKITEERSSARLIFQRGG